MAIAFLGFGTILLLTAALYRRLSKLKLPGGPEIELAALGPALTRPTPGDVAGLTEAASKVAASPGVDASPSELAAEGAAQLEEEKKQAVIAAVSPKLSVEGEGVYPIEHLVSATSPGDEYYEGVIERARQSFSGSGE